MTKRVNTSSATYTYWHGGKSFPIYVGQDGVTKEFILILEELDHREHLQNRYDYESRDYGIEFLKEISASDDRATDPIDFIGDTTYSPETVLFQEEKSKTRKDIINDLIPFLTPDQQSLYRYLMMGLKAKEIAAIFKTSEDAIKKRKRKLIAHLQKLLKEKIQQGLPKSGNRQEPKENNDFPKLPGDESVTKRSDK